MKLGSNNDFKLGEYSSYGLLSASLIVQEREVLNNNIVITVRRPFPLQQSINLHQQCTRNLIVVTTSIVQITVISSLL